MYYFVYQTKNLINGKTYVGVHRTKNVNDGYIGFGIFRQSCADRIVRNGSKAMLPRAVKKYGYENFRREILSFFDTYQEALEEEKWLVNQEWIAKRDNYNTSTGGLGRTNVKISIDHVKKLVSIHSKEYVVHNIESGETFFVKNLTEWCSKNYPELVREPKSKKRYHLFTGVLSGKTKLLAGKWWACRIEDWTGKPIIKKDKKPHVTGRKVLLIGENDNVLREFKSASEASRELNADMSSICKACRGQLKSVKNMRFRYAT